MKPTRRRRDRILVDGCFVGSKESNGRIGLGRRPRRDDITQHRGRKGGGRTEGKLADCCKFFNGHGLVALADE